MEQNGASAELTFPFREWRRLTCFLESARMALAREQALWEGLGIAAVEDVRIKSGTARHRYRVGVEEHMLAVADAEMLHASVLVHSYALAESAATAHLRLDQRSVRGIEDWGARLLQAAGRDWTDVKDGLPGAVEVAVVRNAFAHGTPVIDAPAARRLIAAGGAASPVGTPVTLGYNRLRALRGRLMNLLNVGGIGGDEPLLAAPAPS